jgi:hypothetical protein
MEGILLAAGLKDQRPDLLALLPPCERKWIEGEGWKESLEVLWRKAQELRVMFGSEEAQDSKRACVGFADAGCECLSADDERIEAIEKVCCDPKFWDRNKWRRRYPYGVWACNNGAEYLFNREYKAFLRRSAGGSVVSVEKVEEKKDIDFVRQGWFYDDGNRPQDFVDTQRLLVEVMEAFHAGRDVWQFVINENSAKAKKPLEVVR